MTTQTLTKSGQNPVQLKLKLTGVAGPPSFATQEEERRYGLERLAGAFRIFHKLGYDEAIAGHISMRDPINLDHFWMNPYGVAFDQICVSDLLCVDHDGNIVAGGRPGGGQIYNSAGFIIHSSIHHARPDINAVAHSHSPFGRAFSMTGRNIDMGPYDAASFGDTVRLYNDFGGVVLDESEGEAICEALGEQGKGVILQNHGILSVSSGIEATVAYFVRLEGLCETQLLADAAGIKSVMDSGDREEIFRRAGGDSAAWRDAQALYEALDAETQGNYKL